MASGVQQPTKRIRSGRGCRPCKVRKVKCDETREACHNCNRLGFDCVYDDNAASGSRESPLPKRRTRQACQICRASKLRCSGDVPKCQRCQSQDLECIYEKVSVEDSTSSPPATPQRRQVQHRTSHDIRSTSPDIRKSILQIHIDAFFHYVHATATFNFIHKGSFLRSWHTGKMAKDLVQTVTGVAARFIANSETPPLSDIAALDRPGARWLEDVQSTLLRDMESISIPRLQIMLLLIFDRTASGHLMTAWNILALACRHAFALELNCPTDAILFTNQECRRRLFWCVWYLERTLGQTRGLPGGSELLSQIPQCPREHVYIPLPCNNRLFSLEQETKTVELLEMENGGLDNPDTLGVTAYLIRLIDIRAQIQCYFQYDRCDDDETDETKVASFRDQLHSFQSILPPEMRDTERAMYLHVSTPEIGVYAMIHSWLYTTLCDLNMYLLRGCFNPDTPNRCQDLARTANALNRFWRRLHSVQRFSERFFTTDMDFGRCVMMNTSSLIYTAKENPNHDDEGNQSLEALRDALQLNLDIMLGLSKISHYTCSCLHQIMAEIKEWSPTESIAVDFSKAHPELYACTSTTPGHLFLEDIAKLARRREDARFPNPKRTGQGRHNYESQQRRQRQPRENGLARPSNTGTKLLSGDLGLGTGSSVPRAPTENLSTATAATAWTRGDNNNSWDNRGVNPLDYISPETLSGFAAQNLYGGDESVMVDPNRPFEFYYGLHGTEFDVSSASVGARGMESSEHIIFENM